MTSLDLADLIERCAACPGSDERSELSSQILEGLYSHSASLRVLAPLFENGTAENWRTLAALLYEHSQRSEAVPDWLAQLMDSTDSQTRFWSRSCIMELDTARHGLLQGKVLAAWSESDAPWDNISFTKSVAHPTSEILAERASYVGGALGILLAELAEGKDFSSSLDKSGDSPAAFIAIAWAARQPRDKAIELLERAVRCRSGNAKLAAQALLEQRTRGRVAVAGQPVRGAVFGVEG